MKRIAASTLVAALSLLATDCTKNRPSTGQTPPYLGPTQTMAEVTAEINANNEAVPTLWARHYFEVNIIDENKKANFANGNGLLVYKSPSGMVLTGEKDLAGRLFEIGSSDDRYWLSITPPNENGRMWWGWYRNLGKPCVDMRSIPVRPDLVIQVLGIGMINSNFLQPPVPTMRFNNDADAYMFVWNYPAGNRWAAQKEIWYDRATKLPRRVFLFDEHGRVVLRAKLSGHAPVEMPDVPSERWPKVAHSYELFFPDTGSTMKFELDEVSPESRGVPTKRGISFPKNVNVDKIIQLDRDCVD